MAMETKEQIVNDWLTRYTGVRLRDFGSYVLLTNFQRYVHLFAELTRADVVGIDKPMSSATSGAITIINFGIGSPNAAQIPFNAPKV